MFKRVLIANRGEIAVRIIRALKEMKIESVAIYSDADEYSIFREYSDFSYPLNGCTSSDTYMNIDKIIRIAKEAKVDAIHPGYGFLSENFEFANAVESNGIIFIGPKSETIRLMGDKIEAKRVVASRNLPLVPGNIESIDSYEKAKIIADEIGYPVIIKAAAGGGGVGMRTIFDPKNLNEMFDKARHQAEFVFDNNSVFIEKFIENAKHIEFQIAADKYGNIIHLGERDCSIQRRHQKVIEESPSPIFVNELRNEIGKIAINVAKAVSYQSVGTVEFVYDNGNFYFIEMNTRLQVEHPVTEMTTGIDIVKTQINISQGMRLTYTQDDIQLRGHSIECRILAEDPLKGFRPSPAKITNYRAPLGIGIRVDSGVHANSDISCHYDSMISKLIVWGKDRTEAISRMKEALEVYIIEGPTTNIPYLLAVINSKEFIEGNYNTSFIDTHSEIFELTRTESKRQSRFLHYLNKSVLVE